MTANPQYPGRDQLDTANARFRRAISRLHREAGRHDPKLMPTVERIVREAADTLGRLAADAEAAESTSQRHQTDLKAQEDKLRATLRPAARRGDERAVSILARLDARTARRPGPAPDDAA
ncbi:hypothetical protein [Streptomyces deccanensis]|uniref:hypothetical protein n=1 Tax=Streptomyces deccanensis TaxID=424188 RepID=UPI001EFB3FBF|nr:hypothetical protein [Streptomyces deccanensis]ULR50594.1 hypothetical protein L3078_15505 [Streptomyces deccanensis]